MLNARSIQGIIVGAIVIFLGIWLGLSLVTNQIESIFQISVAVLLITCIFLGRKIWLLLIFFSSLNVVLISGFGTTEIGQALFLTFTTIIFLMRRLPLKVSFGELEWWILLLTLCVIQTFMRNPVGLNVFGAGSVGGKPYILVALSIATACVLGNLKVEPNHIKWAMRLTLLGALMGIPLTILRGEIGAMDESFDNSTNEGATRIPGLNVAGNTLARWLVSYISPLRACFHPLWATVLLISIAAAAGSGYRNAVSGVAITYMFGLYYRGGFQSLAASIVSGGMALMILALINSNFPLPANIQRALSPFPGTWEKRYVQDAENSTEWRVEMWKEALLTDKWIQNKVLGDGVGMTAEQLRANMSMRTSGKTAGGLLVQQENMLINGSYHSGPVHTVRAVGYVGLSVLLMAMIRVAVYAHRQIMRCQGTEWWPVALFFCIPIIAHPIFFVFVFGEFQSGVGGVVMGVAMVRLLEKNLPFPAYVRKLKMPYILSQQPSGNPSESVRA